MMMWPNVRVIGVPDEARGQIVQAHVVLKAALPRTMLTTKRLAGPRQGGHRAL
jgi:acyl-coenzyme A synthetase/AMP-(fatty) acid ligase